MSSNAITAIDVTKAFNLETILEKSRRVVNRLKAGRIRGEPSVQHLALQNVSFDVAKGERVGIIGPNGSGKSTLLRIIMQVMQPTTGTMATTGTIGGLIEFSAGFQLNLTAYENAVINLTMQGMGFKKAKSVAHDVFRLADLEKFKHVPYKYYSSGMGVRIGFLTSLVTHPDIVLLDEVMAVGDVKFRNTSRKMVESFIQDRTVVLVSHNLNEIQNLCDRVLVLNQGRLVHNGDVDAGIELYRSIQRDDKAAPEIIRPVARSGEVAKAPVSITNISVRGPNGDQIEQGDICTVCGELIRLRDVKGDQVVIQYDVKRLDVTGLSTLVSRFMHDCESEGSHSRFKTSFHTQGLYPGDYILEVSASYRHQPQGFTVTLQKATFEVIGDHRQGFVQGADLGFTATIHSHDEALLSRD